MDHRSEDMEDVRSDGSPSLDEETLEKSIALVESRAVDGNEDLGGDHVYAENEDDDVDLPQCKIKRNYSCNLCPFFSQNPRSFLYHSRDVHFDRIKIYECSQCLYASKHSQKLQRHINMIHVPGKTRKTRNKMTKPSRTEPRPIRPKPPDPQPEPSLEVSTVQDEKLQEVVEEPEKTGDGEFKCSACNFKHKNPKLLRRHEKIVHLKKRYLKCSKCSYVTHVTARFTKHVKYHSMPMIKCDLCDFRTPYKWNLDRHYKNHSGSGAFQCAKCNFRADIKQSLTVHEMNHHVPPVGQGAVMARKKNKVGGSDIQDVAIERVESAVGLLPLEKESGGSLKNQPAEQGKTEKAPALPKPRKLSHNKRESNSNHLQTDFIHPDDIVPRYGQIFVKNLKCKFCSYKAVFSHEIWRHEKRIHGFVRPENKKGKTPKRPPPQLIPIQSKNSSGAILKIPSVKNKSAASDATALEKQVNETEFNEMCKKSSLTSSLKDFVSLIGDEEGLKTIPDSSTENLEVENSEVASESVENLNIIKCEEQKQKQTDLLKKKNASFFDKLKEKLLTGNNEEQSLYCEVCGHESKCLSESVAHQKRHSNSNNKSDSDGHNENDIIPSGGKLSSTRCQYCRQRCKTSTDLINHLKTCKAFEASLDSQCNSDDVEEMKTDEVSLGSKNDAKMEDENSMENRVFVWNDMSQIRSEIEESEEDEQLDEEPLETSPGYGTVTSKGSDNTESGTLVMNADPRLNVTVKKVFKCPHCPFWASTASRFHVHIVGHLNKKPFECSLCAYRSNWRWDITKHIRLKSLRDPDHSQANVNMTDETGRRNYSKYNKYLTMMRVQEPTAESSGYGRRSRSGEAPTQGNAKDVDIIPLPAPPKLTRAPTPGTTQQMPQGGPLRPPPPLKAAHQVQQPVSKQSKESGKKTFWKCKKCNFRDPQKGRVLLHVKKHYVFKRNQKGLWSHTCNPKLDSYHPVSGEKPTSEVKPRAKSPSYSCGHCHQVSNWKHVIQRHCKLKHNGYSLIEINYKDGTTSTTGGKVEEETEDLVKTISCDICPFTTDTEGDLTAHKLNHIDRPGSIFKCTYCPFYVPSKIAVIEHMELHGVSDGCDWTTIKVDNFDPNLELIPKKEGNEGTATKKYKCVQCPYISHSRTQFLYHKQFHRPRNSPFKCLYCTYSVSRRHLLHQHLRVHHSQKTKSVNEVGKSETENESATVEPNEVETLAESDIMNETEKSAETDISNEIEKSAEPDTTNETEKSAEPGVIKEAVPLIEPEKVKPQERSAERQETLCEEETLVESETENDPETTQLSNKSLSKKHVKVKHPDIPDIPLVWVSRCGNIQKMYKCRWCPHVNTRKVNIQEHEKMHQGKESKKSGSNWGFKLHCADCNYSCNNPGVYASHVKVHQGFHGEIRSLFDPTRPESEQIEELKNNLKENTQKHELDEGGQDSEVELEEEKPSSCQPENNHTPRNESSEESDECKKVLSFCEKCPARFFYSKELQVHSKFHMIHLPFRCSYCTYTARQRPHLLAHYKVHSQAYHDKTKYLKEIYPVSPEYPQPKTVKFIKESNMMEGPVWMVQLKRVQKKKEGKSQPRHSCHRCPAKFFKSVALQYHLTLHGGSNKHKCKYCDYTVKTHGNLMKHQVVHERNYRPSKGAKFSYSFPISGTDLLQAQDETDNQVKTEEKRRKEPIFGALMHGSAEFIYPTYMKMGKVKEKKYKCHKCPSAFEKRNQYHVHSTLHGSKQKYQCEKCDYSVKYYANYAQHLRRHEHHSEALIARKSSEKVEPVESKVQIEDQEESRTYELTLLERQTLVLQERKKSVECRDEDRKIFNCEFCPYWSSRKDVIENHSWRHFCMSGIKSSFECSHCDYTSSQSNFLREHIKIHFSNSSHYKAEAYLRCEKMELWCCDDDSGDPRQVLIFQDRGAEQPDRYYPPMSKHESEQAGNHWKIYINEKLAKENEESQECFEITDDSQNNDLMKMIEEDVEEEVQMKKTKPKRSRGKNWRCKKCPHAFGKRDQFMRHISLHGSNQKHNCDLCDYSVKYYTNYVQHMRMHQMNEPNRVIHVKKNFKSSVQSPKRLLPNSEGERSDLRCSGEERPNTESECGFQSLDDDNSQCSEKLIIDEKGSPCQNE